MVLAGIKWLEIYNSLLQRMAEWCQPVIFNICKLSFFKHLKISVLLLSLFTRWNSLHKMLQDRLQHLQDALNAYGPNSQHFLTGKLVYVKTVTSMIITLTMFPADLPFHFQRNHSCYISRGKHVLLQWKKGANVMKEISNIGTVWILWNRCWCSWTAQFTLRTIE